MKMKVSFSKNEIAELLAQRVATLFQVPALAANVKQGTYSWDAWVVEVDDEPAPVPVPITHPITDYLGDVQQIAA